ncbi:MAG: VOC family protein [Chryseolinea sp.]
MSKSKSSQNGKVCYLEIPAVDIDTSATFYEAVFGWKIRRSEEGSIAFDDGAGQVSGMWVKNKRPMSEPGIIVSIMVDDAEETEKRVPKSGGTIIASMKLDSGEVIVHFKDPAGNFMGMYQDGGN